MFPLIYDSYEEEICRKYNFISMTSLSSRTTLPSKGEKEYKFSLFRQCPRIHATFPPRRDGQREEASNDQQP